MNKLSEFPWMNSDWKIMVSAYQPKEKYFGNCLLRYLDGLML